MRGTKTKKAAISGQFLIVVLVVLIVAAGASAVVYAGMSTSSSTVTSVSTATAIITSFLTPSTTSITTTSSTQVVLPALNLTIIGSAATKVLNASQVQALTSMTAQGGFEGSTGTVSGFGTYTGVPLITLCNLVGGLTNTSIVNVTSKGGLSAVYTYQQVLNGQGFTTYNPTTGSQITATQPLTLILAFAVNDTALGSVGPLRAVVVGPQGLLTVGSVSVLNVVSIHVTTPPATTTTSSSTSTTQTSA